MRSATARSSRGDSARATETTARTVPRALRIGTATDREAPKQPPQPKGESKGGVTGSEVRPVRFR